MMLTTWIKSAIFTAYVSAAIAIFIGNTVVSATEIKNANSYDQHGKVQAFIRELTERDAFSQQELRSWFSTANRQQQIIDAISRPAEKTLSWKEYRERFITQDRVEKGVAFYREHQADLRRAEQQFGVAAEIIVAVIGVETHYGRHKGQHRVMDALSTLAFDYPPRANFFRKELREFLLLSREQQLDPRKPMGSYAGAMGYGQFIPSSYRVYAIDFDGDNRVDIWENATDAIGSVANYFKVHGWQKNEPVAISVDVLPTYNEKIVNSSLKPKITIQELRDQGIILATRFADGEITEKQLATIMRLQGVHGPEFWLGLQNFYVITRYNHSRLYAMAVWQLSQSIEQELQMLN